MNGQVSYNNSVVWTDSKLHRPSDRRLSEKLVPTFEDTECRVVNTADPSARNLGFLDRSFFFFKPLLNFLTRLSAPRSFSENLVAQGIKSWPLDL
jgi:hypothetical protein